MRRSSPRLIFVLGLAVATTSAARALHAADPQTQQLAQALFDEGRRLMDAKRYSDACPKLAESQRLDPGGGTLLNLALCHEKEGKLATAQVDFNEALSLAVKDGRKDREKIARERIAVIEPAMPRVTIVVGAEVEGLEVKLDGLVLRRVAWGIATPIDLGDHLLEASAPGRIPWSSSFALEPSQRRSIEVPALRVGQALPPGAPAGGTGSAAPKSASAPETVDSTTPPPGAKQDNPFFYLAIGVTIVATGTSLVTGLIAFGNNTLASTGCLPDRNFCRDQQSADAASRTTTHAWISTISLGVALAGAVSIFFIPQRISATRSSVNASALPGGGALSVSGSF